ncbi:MAG: folylpolyglutamate synthase/dihydrofolate synthase family protein [Oscillospiraceae bacterium]|nr:folylpolyglutamate synthase/dihydrofolate synthase family protein [Oscillospiraceae bacterium]
MTYQEALTYIHSISWRGSKPGLERISEMMEQLGNVQEDLKFIHIAGTNGKGSVSAMLSSVLTAAGYRTGLFISPYIMRFNERMQVNGMPISDEELAEIVAEVQPVAESMAERPTEFEIITAAAFLWFARQKCDIVVLETGLGGRLDATNLISKNVCAVITNLGMDHTEYLGNTLGEIAGEKCGILKPGCPVVAYRSAPEAMKVIRARAKELECPVRTADFGKIKALSADLQGQTFQYKQFPELTVHLLGAHQLKNAAVALETISVLRKAGWEIPDEAVVQGMDATRWPGRFEVLQDNPLVIVDGAHNPQGVESLIAAVKEYLPGQHIVCVTGVLADKDWKPMMDRLKTVVSDFVAVTPDSPRALGNVRLARYLTDREHWVSVADDVEKGLTGALERAKATGGMVLACGSLYMAADVRRFFGRN